MNLAVRPKRARPTLADVAQIAGVSVMTVSAVLSGKKSTSRFSAETQQRVLEAAASLGIRVDAMRIGALLVAALLAGIGGGYLSLAYSNTFVEGMSAGRGFIALAIVVFGRWHPLGILAGSLLFGAANAGQFHLQAAGIAVSYHLLLMLPYALTLAVLAFASGTAAAPAALGRRRGE